MRMLEQLECTPSPASAKHPTYRAIYEDISPAEIDAASVPNAGTKRDTEQIITEEMDSQEELAGNSSVQQNGRPIVGSQDQEQKVCRLSALQSSDIVALAALTVQLFTRQIHHRPALDTDYWHSQVPSLPASAQHFVLACLCKTPVSMQKLLRHSFFNAEVRAAAEFIARLDDEISHKQPGAWKQSPGQPSRSENQLATGCGPASAIQAVLEGRLSLELLAQQGALRLCTHSIASLIAEAARGDSTSGAAASSPQHDAATPQSTGAAVAEVLSRLINLLPRSLAIQGPLQVFQSHTF